MRILCIDRSSQFCKTIAGAALLLAHFVHPREMNYKYLTLFFLTQDGVTFSIFFLVVFPLYKEEAKLISLPKNQCITMYSNFLYCSRGCFQIKNTSEITKHILAILRLQSNVF